MRFLYGGRVPLFPALNWVDTGTVVRGTQPVVETGGFGRVASLTMSVSGNGWIEWNVSIPAESTGASGAVEGVLSRLERATQLAGQFDLVGRSGVSIELRLIEDGQSVDVVHRNYYFSRPELTFYLSAGSVEDMRWVWAGLKDVLHELVHFRGISVDMSNVNDDFSMVREEIAASIVEFCSLYLGGLSEEGVGSVAFAVNPDMPDDQVMLDRYRVYGPTLVGGIIGGHWVLGDYIEHVGTDETEAVVTAEQATEFSRHCSETFEAAKSVSVIRTATRLRVERQ